MKAKRVNWERKMLCEFINVAQKHGYEPILGQSSNNRILLGGNLYFQFGDLRVETKSRHVVIEAESAGGVTNLVKYWYCLKEPQEKVSKPIVLLHIFRITSDNDYGSHLLLWEYLYKQMAHDLKNCIQARKFRIDYIDESRNELPDALKHFEDLIR